MCGLAHLTAVAAPAPGAQRSGDVRRALARDGAAPQSRCARSGRAHPRRRGRCPRLADPRAVARRCVPCLHSTRNRQRDDHSEDAISERGSGATIMSDRAVEGAGLTRVFDTFVAVDHIDLQVEKGTVFGFLGPNGAGKSTTIRMLCGILRPSAGGGTVGGFDIVRQTEQLKSHIGYMSQRFSLYEDLTVQENLRFFAGVYNVRGAQRNARIAWALEMAGLRGREQVKSAELAGGWGQGLALGCGVLHEPPILFLDEPTSGVDPASRRNFWEMIGELSTRGITVLVTTNYMGEDESCEW